ncbi:MAG TPA: hypothetical protein VGM44_21140, partial [Polyangiaceae bacterium]
MQTRSVFFLGCLALQIAACATPAPAPSSPAPSAPAAPKPEPAPTPAADAGPAPETVASAPPAATPAPTAETKTEPDPVQKPSRPPIEIITSPDTAFLINYPESAPLEVARKTCSDKGGSDDEAIATCMNDARAAFKPDVLRFKKNGKTWDFVIYKRDGSRLDEIYSARVDLSE